jgi:hypothetical protein
MGRHIRFRNRNRDLLSSLVAASSCDSLPGTATGLSSPSAALSRTPTGVCGGAATVRTAWIDWLAPVFAENGSCYFTGTYSDEYGEPHGLMAVRNVMKDFRRWLAEWDFGGQYIIGVEKHAFRDVLHLHAIIEGPLTLEQMRILKEWWGRERGHARALPVLDGCASYVTKYALKGDSDGFEWRLS